MKKGESWILWAGMVIAVWIAGWSALGFYLLEKNLAAMAPNTDISGYKIRFGLVEVDSSDNATFSKETAEIPFRLGSTGFHFGPEITPPDEKPYSYHFVFHFSAPPKILSDSFAGKEPSKTMETNEVQIQKGVTVDAEWFDEGDPIGDESVDVYINGKLAKTINFKVVEEK